MLIQMTTHRQSDVFMAHLYNKGKRNFDHDDLNMKTLLAIKMMINERNDERE